MHVRWADVPFAHLVGNVNQVERGVEVVLPASFFVNEKRKHLVKVKEVRLGVLLVMGILGNLVNIHPIKRIGLANDFVSLYATFLCH